MLKTPGVLNIQSQRRIFDERNIVVAMALTLSIIVTATFAYAGGRLTATGNFTANVNFTTLTFTPVGANCLLETEASFDFTGTLTGVANRTTRALVLAPCGDVQINPPGTFRDVFRSNLEFLGTLDGHPVMADLRYQGVTETGGTIKGEQVIIDGTTYVLYPRRL